MRSGFDAMTQKRVEDVLERTSFLSVKDFVVGSWVLLSQKGSVRNPLY